MSTKENKMGTMPIPKLLLSMAVPMAASMLVQALYNIVDSAYVSRISEDALTALSLVFPVQNLIISVGVGTGVGVNALLSRSLGEGKPEKAQSTARNGLFLAVACSFFFAALCLIGARPFLLSQKASEAITHMGIQYMSITGGLCVITFLQLMCERLLQSTGRTLYSMLSQAVGAIVNIVLDPLFIFGAGPIPAMGVVGAAVATMLGQLVGLGIGLFCNIRYNKELSFSFRGFRPSGSIIRQIYAVGLPSIVMISIGSVMSYGMNRILMTFTSTAAAVFGAYFKLQSFVFMPIFGMNSGMVPIIAYNLGARHRDRITKTIKLAMITAVCIMLIGFGLFQLFPSQLLMLFDASREMLDIGVPALRIISYSFLFAGFNLIFSSVFQSLGNGVYSLLNSAFRQLVILLPAALALAVAVGLKAVWWSLPIAEVGSLVLAVILFKKIYREKIQTLSE